MAVDRNFLKAILELSIKWKCQVKFDQLTKIKIKSFDQTPNLTESFDQLKRWSEIWSSDHFPPLPVIKHFDITDLLHCIRNAWTAVAKLTERRVPIPALQWLTMTSLKWSGTETNFAEFKLLILKTENYKSKHINYMYTGKMICFYFIFFSVHKINFNRLFLVEKVKVRIVANAAQKIVISWKISCQRRDG